MRNGPSGVNLPTRTRSQHARSPACASSSPTARRSLRRRFRDWQHAKGCGRRSCCKTSVEYIKRAGDPPRGSFADLCPETKLWPGAAPLPLCHNFRPQVRGGPFSPASTVRLRGHARAPPTRAGRNAFHMGTCSNHMLVAPRAKHGHTATKHNMYAFEIDRLACNRLAWSRARYFHHLTRSANCDDVLYSRTLSFILKNLQGDSIATAVKRSTINMACHGRRPEKPTRKLAGPFLREPTDAALSL